MKTKRSGSARVEYLANKSQVETLLAQGYSAESIHTQLSLNMSVRQLQRLVKSQYVGQKPQSQRQAQQKPSLPPKHIPSQPPALPQRAEVGKFTQLTAEELEQAGFGWPEDPSQTEGGEN